MCHVCYVWCGRPTKSIEDICTIIGDSPVLFKEFGKVCVEKVLVEKQMFYAVVLRHTVMAIQKDKVIDK
jgi:hypothetical protein